MPNNNDANVQNQDASEATTTPLPISSKVPKLIHRRSSPKSSNNPIPSSTYRNLNSSQVWILLKSFTQFIEFLHFLFSHATKPSLFVNCLSKSFSCATWHGLKLWLSPLFRWCYVRICYMFSSSTTKYKWHMNRIACN